MRQEWLETRLETLLLTKKRHRPGARGKRNQVSTAEKTSCDSHMSVDDHMISYILKLFSRVSICLAC